VIEIGKALEGETGRSVYFDLSVLIETRLLVQGSSGSGKSQTLRRLLEQSYGKVQQIVFDLDGEYSTLREKYDYVLAGKNGDIPAQPKTAGLLATRILELGASLICDLYDLDPDDRILFGRNFLESLMRAPKSLYHPVMVVIDEAHVFCPEDRRAQSTNAVISLASQGRKRGFCLVAATQRIAKFNKNACSEIGNKMIGRTFIENDRSRAAEELGMRRKDSVILRKKRVGEFHIYGPAVRIGNEPLEDVINIKVGGILTTHPQIGTRYSDQKIQPRKKVLDILSKLKDLPIQAEKQERDLQTAERQLYDLRGQLKKLQGQQPQPQPCDHEPLIKTLKDQIIILTTRNDKYWRLIEEFEKTTKSDIPRLYEIYNKVIGDIGLLRIAKTELPKIIPMPPTEGIPKRPATYKPVSTLAAAPGVNPGISKPRQNILDVLASFEAIGFDRIARASLAAMCGVSSLSSGYTNNLSGLRSHKADDIDCPLIAYPDGGYVSLTDEGRKFAKVTINISCLNDLHEAWYRMISKPRAAILRHLIKIYPDDIARDELAEAVGVSATSSGYTNNLSGLRVIGAIEYPPKKGGYVKATDLLFPEGLA
jgi:uncharacterized protein